MILTTLIICFSCSQTNKTSYITNLCKGARPFVVDTPIQMELHYRIQAVNDFLGFKKLDQPSDTFFFRVSYGKKNVLKFFEYAVCDTFQSFKSFVIPTEPRGRILFDKEKDNLKNYATVFDPKQKGKGFIDKLTENHILDLPHPEQIKGYPYDEATSYGCSIEYSCRSKYKAVLYFSPRLHSTEFNEAKRLMDFMDYLEKEFGF
jgi:hypothetical protein